MNFDEAKAVLKKQIEEKEYEQEKLLNHFSSCILKAQPSFSSLILPKEEKTRAAKEIAEQLASIVTAASIVEAEVSFMKKILNDFSGVEESEETFSEGELVLIKSDPRMIYTVLNSSKGECGTVRYLIEKVNGRETELVISKNLKKF